MAVPGTTGQKWYQQPRYANMVGQRPVVQTTAPAWRESERLRQAPGAFGAYDDYVANAVRKHTPRMAAAAPMRSADVHLQNVLAGTAKSIYDEQWQSRFAHHSGHTVPVPGGGFRVHPMQLSIPTTPRRPPQADPNDAGKWWASQPAGVAAGRVDTDALNAFAMSRVGNRPTPAGGGTVSVNRNDQGVPTGFTVAGAVPTQAASNLAVARLNRGVTDPKMMYKAAGPNQVIDPFGATMTYDAARSRIAAINAVDRDRRTQQMADTAMARRQMDRERAQAAQWNMMMARQVDPRHPLSPIAQERAMTAAMPRRMTPNEIRQADAMDAQQKMQTALTQQAIDFQQLQMDAMRKQQANQLTPQQQFTAQALQAAAANPALSPEQRQQASQQAMAMLGVAPGIIPQPQLFGLPTLQKFPQPIADLLSSAKSRDELWDIGKRQGVFRDKDDKSIALFQRMEKELGLTTPTADAILQFSPFPVPGDFARQDRGEESRSLLMRALDNWRRGN